MTDKELLELAAKAAGISLEFRVLMWTDGSVYPCYEDKNSICVSPMFTPVIKWNPLVDDADAFRLAIKLQLAIAIDPDQTWAHHTEVVRGSAEPHGKDPLAATRRAIVRCAAEIGKGMK